MQTFSDSPNRWDGGVTVRFPTLLPRRANSIAVGGLPQKRITQYCPSLALLRQFHTEQNLSRTAISEYRQNPMQGAIKHSLFQGTSRVLKQVPYVVPPFVIGASILSSAMTALDLFESQRMSSCNGLERRTSTTTRKLVGALGKFQIQL